MDNEKKGSGLKVLLGLIIVLIIFVGYATVSAGSVKNFVNKLIKGNEQLEKIVDDISNEDLDKEFTSISNSLEEKYSKEEKNKDEVTDPDKEEKENASNSVSSEEIENFNIDIDSTVEVQGTKVTLKSSGIVDQKHQTEYLKSTLTNLEVTDNDSPVNDMGLGNLVSLIGSMNFSVEMYIDMENQKSYTKLPAMAGLLGLEGAGEWQPASDSSASVDIAALLDKLTNSGKNEKIDENTYKTVISGEEAQKAMPSSLGNKEIDSNLFREDIPVIYTVEEGKITSIRFDFSGLGAAAEMDFYVVISNYNKAGDLIIPDEVTKSSK